MEKDLNKYLRIIMANNTNEIKAVPNKEIKENLTRRIRDFYNNQHLEIEYNFIIKLNNDTKNIRI